MKIRSGFVSNSSSSSFVVQICVPTSVFVDNLLNDDDFCLRDKFNKAVFKEYLKERLQELERSIEEDKRLKKHPLFKHLADSCKGEVKEIGEVLKVFDSLTDLQLLVMVLKYNGIKMRKHNKEYVELYHWTSMHNYFIESLPDLLKEIMFYYTFNKNVKILAKQESDY
jgi:hypothetical protein